MGRSTPVQRRSLREAQRESTRRNLKSAALRIFVEGDFYNSSIDMIAREAGVTRATFYLHFPSKRAVLWELLSEEVLRQKGVYDRLAALPSVDIPALAHWLELFVRTHRRGRRIIRLAQLAFGLDPELNQLFADARDTFIDALATRYPGLRWRDHGAESTARNRIAAHFLILEIDQLCVSLALGAWTLDRPRSITLVAERIARFLKHVS